MRPRRVPAWCVLLALSLPAVVHAQRELHWERLEVDARLDATGRLHIEETQKIVFTGDWNGGERRFNVRPRQTLSFTGISRASAAGYVELREDRGLRNVDDYAWTDSQTVRWRSRLPTDPPFARTALTYVLRYELSGILAQENDRYVLNHDFAFPDRAGTIDAFALRLTFDPAWQPLTEVQTAYMTAGIAPGRGYVLTIPLRFSGTGVPEAREGLSPQTIAGAVSAVLGLTALAVLALFLREQSYGRFVPVTTTEIDHRWIADRVLKYPAEVVGAAWDDSIGTPEVVALIARMVSEGKLESDLAAPDDKTSLRLRLKANRSTLEGYERTLVEALFFDGRTETSTEEVRAHYRETGFDPAAAIRPELEAVVRERLEAGDPPKLIGALGVVWFLAGAALLWAAWYRGEIGLGFALFVGIAALIATGIARGAGVVFRSRMDWGRRAALVCFVPAIVGAAATAVYIWFYVGTGANELSLYGLIAIVALSLWVTYNTFKGLKSQTSRAAVAVRKDLTAGREFFSALLRQPDATLRDEWYPWVLALGLGKQADDWSGRRASTRIERPAAVTRVTSDRLLPLTRSSLATALAVLAVDAQAARAEAPPGRPRPPAWPRRLPRHDHPRTPPAARRPTRAAAGLPGVAVAAAGKPTFNEQLSTNNVHIQLR